MKNPVAGDHVENGGWIHDVRGKDPPGMGEAWEYAVANLVWYGLMAGVVWLILYVILRKPLGRRKIIPHSIHWPAGVGGLPLPGEPAGVRIRRRDGWIRLEVRLPDQDVWSNRQKKPRSELTGVRSRHLERENEPSSSLLHAWDLRGGRSLVDCRRRRDCGLPGGSCLAARCGKSLGRTAWILARRTGVPLPGAVGV